MDVGRKLVTSPSPFTVKHHFRIIPPSSVSMLHEQAALSLTSMPTASITRYLPTSIRLQEQREELRALLQIREDKTSQATMDQSTLENDLYVEEDKHRESDLYLRDFQRQLLHCRKLSYLLPSFSVEEKSLLSMPMEPIAPDKDPMTGVNPVDVLALAKEALLASKQAVSFAENSNLFGADIADPFTGPGCTSSTMQIPVKIEIKVRSKRLLERRFKNEKRVESKSEPVPPCTSSFKKPGNHRQANKAYDPNNPLRSFTSSSDSRPMSTKEESEYFIQIQEVIRLEEVKSKLQSQFDRDPTLVEWAEAVGISCRVLQAHVRSGKSSREKIIRANFRLVVHVAKFYQGQGVDVQDLIQEGTIGLMKSIEKFKPQGKCRFSSYAYWWIRQSVRQYMHKNSRIIRLPENIYAILRQIWNAKKLYKQEGYNPSNEELAGRVGISVDKMTKLLVAARTPLSISQQVSIDNDTTFQEIIADTVIETPDRCVSKQLMRQHVRNLVNTLDPKESRIVRLRYGIEDGERKSLSEIGVVFGLSKERIRQLELAAIDKLKTYLSSQGLESYTSLLI